MMLNIFHTKIKQQQTLFVVPTKFAVVLFLCVKYLLGTYSHCLYTYKSLCRCILVVSALINGNDLEM